MTKKLPQGPGEIDALNAPNSPRTTEIVLAPQRFIQEMPKSAWGQLSQRITAITNWMERRSANQVTQKFQGLPSEVMQLTQATEQAGKTTPQDIRNLLEKLTPVLQRPDISITQRMPGELGDAIEAASAKLASLPTEQLRNLIAQFPNILFNHLSYKIAAINFLQNNLPRILQQYGIQNKGDFVRLFSAHSEDLERIVFEGLLSSIQDPRLKREVLNILGLQVKIEKIIVLSDRGGIRLLKSIFGIPTSRTVIGKKQILFQGEGENPKWQQMQQDRLKTINPWNIKASQNLGLQATIKAGPKLMAALHNSQLIAFFKSLETQLTANSSEQEKQRVAVTALSVISFLDLATLLQQYPEYLGILDRSKATNLYNALIGVNSINPQPGHDRERKNSAQRNQQQIETLIQQYKAEVFKTVAFWLGLGPEAIKHEVEQGSAVTHNKVKIERRAKEAIKLTHPDRSPSPVFVNGKEVTKELATLYASLLDALKKSSSDTINSLELSSIIQEAINSTPELQPLTEDQDTALSFMSTLKQTNPAFYDFLSGNATSK